jgi:hypothetical protein
MIIGQPQRLEDFKPLEPAEFERIRQQIDPVLSRGVPLETPVGLDLGTVARLLSTIGHFAVQLQAHAAPAVDADAPPVELPPLPFLRRDE